MYKLKKPGQEQSTASKRLKKQRDRVLANLKRRIKEWDGFSDKLNENTVSFADLNFMERKCRKIIKAYNPVIQTSTRKTTQKRFETEKENFRSILTSIWQKYIELYSEPPTTLKGRGFC